MKRTDTSEGDIARLKKERAAFQAHCELFGKFISMARRQYKPQVLKAMLQKTIDVAIELTDAEHGSIILLDKDGIVVDSILARGETSPDRKAALIGTVIRKGLAGWVARHREIGLVHDTRVDDRWFDFPDQPPFSVGSALALPVVSGELLLGILTLMHHLPGYFKKNTADLMKITANQMALVLENATLFNNLNVSMTSLEKAKKEIEAYSLALDREIEKCCRIQQDFLPKQLPQLPDWEFAAFFFPANRASGDFYDAFMLPGGYAGFVIGDVCDKGVGAALFMALFRSLIRIFSGQARLRRSTADRQSQTVGGQVKVRSIRHYDQIDALRTVALTNDYIAQEHDEMCMFATLFFGVLDPSNGKLAYINGGHEAAFVLDRNGIRESLSKTGPAVGVFPEATYRYKQIQLKPGDILFAYTDGVPDARSPDHANFTKERLFSLLSHPASTATELLQRIGTPLFAHIGKAPQEDDITMLALQRNKA
ncbi:MAG: GAF domain-containing SpoIIE family protein phosphatase [Desulfobacterales bacterium]